MKYAYLKTLSLALALASTSALALHDSGAYMEANIGTNYSSVNFLGGKADSNSTLGFNANLGYQIARYFAAEMGYTYYGGDLKTKVYDAAGKLILPLGDRLNIFGKLGGAHFAGNTDSNNLPYVGIGSSFQLSNYLDFNVQAQGAKNLFSKNLGLLSMGLTYHFN